MSERIQSHERQPLPQAKIERFAAERLKTLEHAHEHQSNQAEQVETAREKIRQSEVKAAPQEQAKNSEPVVRHPLTKASSYRHTMVSLQHRMKPLSRSFSRLIHRPAIETASEALAKTVMRPSVSLGATTTAVILSGFIYIYARYYGFALRGSEIIVTLVLGGILGFLIEMIVKTYRRWRGQL